MKSNLLFSTALKLLLAGLVWNGLAARQTALAADSRPANGQILQFEGDVKLLRSNGRRIVPTPGTQLYPGDRVEVERSGNVLLQCEDLTVQSILAGSIQLNNCSPVSEKKCSIPGVLDCPDRGDEILWYDPAVPYIISPRRTKLLSSTPPLLRWNPIPDATRYTVTLLGSNWETEVSESQVLYAGDPLQPGKSYFLIINADTGPSSRSEPPNNLGFRVLDEQTAQTVRQEQQKIEGQPLSETGKTLAIAHLYRKYELFAEAIALLETLTHSDAATAAIYHQLGDLYFENLALPAPARQSYTQAIERVDPIDLEAQAAIQVGLGRSHAALGDTETAKRWLTLAKNGYETLGDRERVEALERIIDSL